MKKCLTRKCPMKIMLCQMFRQWHGEQWRSNISKFKSSSSKRLKSCEKNVLHWVLLYWSWKILLHIAQWIVEINDQFSSFRAVRIHDTNICTILGGYSYSECKNLFYQIMPYVLLSTQWYKVLWKFCQRYKNRLKIYIFSKLFLMKRLWKENIIIWNKRRVSWWSKPLRWIREKSTSHGNSVAMCLSNRWKNRVVLNVDWNQTIVDRSYRATWKF